MFDTKINERYISYNSQMYLIIKQMKILKDKNN